MNMDRYIGRLLDNRYEILEIIGTGGMAVVYKARCHRLNRMVAIKILKDEYSRDEEFRRRFHAEGEAVAMLSHPNIVAVYDVSISDDADYIVMELIDGITLKQYMEKKGVLNWKETLHFSMQIAKALEHAHERGIIHRDIKPHNVMLLKNGSVKVADFGIARVMSKSNTLTKEALGSVHYISPEQAKGGWVDNRSDLYSIGVVMYEMMSGRPPYDGESPVAVAIQHINGGAPMPSTLNPNIPGGLEQIIMKSMALDVKERYASATEMLKDMDEFRKDPTILFGMVQPAMDDATKVLQTAAVAEALRQPRTTAERRANSVAGTQRPRPTGTQQRPQEVRRGPAPRPVPAAPRPAASARPSTNRADAARRKREEEERNRVATIAVVTCSAVAIIAIIIFLIALFSGAIFGGNGVKVTVPQLEGAVYDTQLQEKYEGLSIQLLDKVYDETVPKGQIISQEPGANAQVVQGTVIKVVVSLGPEPLEKLMIDMRDLDLEQAKLFLDRQNLDLIPIVKSEFSDEYEEGRVTRTNPGDGEKLTKGQTIWIWVSSGPMIETAKMPDVLGKSYATAYNILVDLGFKNIRSVTEESDADKDEVIRQSVPRGTELDITSEIVLTISKGPKPTEEPTEKETEAPTERATEPPTEPEEEEVTMLVTIELPTDRTEDYVLSLYQDGKPVMEDTIILAGVVKIDTYLTGSGIEYFDLYINGEFYKTVKVDFTING